MRVMCLHSCICISVTLQECLGWKIVHFGLCPTAMDIVLWNPLSGTWKCQFCIGVSVYFSELVYFVLNCWIIIFKAWRAAYLLQAKEKKNHYQSLLACCDTLIGFLIFFGFYKQSKYSGAIFLCEVIHLSAKCSQRMAERREGWTAHEDMTNGVTCFI